MSTTGERGIAWTKKKPRTMGIAVPNARRRRNDKVSPANARRDMEGKRKAERPEPEITIPVVVPGYSAIRKRDNKGITGLTYTAIRK